LNTDLLGDAIESALSESGGTKDIGLLRTLDHIRHFMVGLLAPTMRDTIFDPACGTGGFLFNAFEYATEAIDAQSRGADEEPRFPG
jgi:type I restriction-modification system DNA methylase subunit